MVLLDTEHQTFPLTVPTTSPQGSPRVSPRATARKPVGSPHTGPGHRRAALGVHDHLPAEDLLLGGSAGQQPLGQRRGLTPATIASVLKYWARPPHMPASLRSVLPRYSLRVWAMAAPFRDGACGVGEAASRSGWPHPYHGSAAKRRANPRRRRSRGTVGAAVMGSVAARSIDARVVTPYIRHHEIEIRL